MDIKIKNKKGIVLHTADTYISEDIKVTLDESFIQPKGTLKVESLGEHDVKIYEKVDVDIEGQIKTVTPTEELQEVIPDEGNLLGKVWINPIPSDYYKPEGNIDIIHNGTVDVAKYKTATVYVPTPQPALQTDKTVTPTKDVQTITASQGYYGLKQVTVEAIPDDYIIPEGTFETNVEGTFNVVNYATANFSVDKEQLNITPTTETQTYTPSANKYYNSVVINPIPSDYIIPSGTLNITTNGVHNVSEYANVNVDASNGLPLEVNELPILDTTIPTSGHIQKLHFNKELSFEEIYNILSSLTYIDLSSFGLSHPAYVVFASMKTATACLVLKVDAGGTDVYHLFIIPDFFTVLQSGGFDDLTYSYVSVYKDGLEAHGTWNETIPDPKYVDDSYILNDEVLPSVEGLELGTENEKLKDLFSNNSVLNGAIYKTSNKDTIGTPIPTKGYLDKIYVNTTLSAKEVYDRIKNTEPFLSGIKNNTESYFLGLYELYHFKREGDEYYSGLDVGYFIASDGEGLRISVANGDGDPQTIFEFGFAEEQTFNGWDPNFNGVINVNYEWDVANGDSIVNGLALHNEDWSFLFSITPFERSYYLCENNNFKELLTPTDSLEITKTGTYDVTNYAEVVINIPTYDGSLEEGELEVSGFPIEVSELPEAGVLGTIYKLTTGEYYLYENNEFIQLGKGGGNSDEPSGDPISVTTAEGMDALLVAENKGKIFLYTGEDTEVYKNGKMYIVEEI